MFSMGARKGFWYKDLVNYQIEQLREKGILDQLIRKHLEPISSTQDYICSTNQVNKEHKNNYTIVG